MKRDAVLPEWARAISPGKIEVDAELFYPAILAELGIDEEDASQYWLAVAKAVMRMDVQVAVAGTNLAPTPGGALTILVKDATKAKGHSRFAMRFRDEGDGSAAGAMAARDHYKRLRGVLPA